MIDKSRSVSAQIAADVLADNDQAVLDTVVEFVQQRVSAIGTAVNGYFSVDYPLVAAAVRLTADAMYKQLDGKGRALADSTVTLLRPKFVFRIDHIPSNIGNKEADHDND